MPRFVRHVVSNYPESETMKVFSSEQKSQFVPILLRWFAAAMRPLPWRENYEPYSVWISEIMLQQTQMERGVRYFNAWMARFPTLRSVAEADESDILSAWEGLGYYSRARNLHTAAKQVMEKHGGEFPQSVDAIRRLPGVGEYTAGAIASIAYNQPEPAVDANVMRIFARLCDIEAPPSDKAAKAFITDMVASLMPVDAPRLFNQALMEFGALVCGKKPQCEACPTQSFCEAYRQGTVSIRPDKKRVAAYTTLEMTAAIIVHRDRVFIRQRPQGGLWGGLWEFPGGQLNPGESPDQAACRHVREALGVGDPVCQAIAVVRHGYTTNRVTMHGYLCELADRDFVPPEMWVTRDDLSRYAFPAGHRKLLEHLGWK